jgi:hypothetical protein
MSLEIKRDNKYFKLAFTLKTLGLKNIIDLKQCKSCYRKILSDYTLKINNEDDVIPDIPICYYPIYIMFYFDSNFLDRKNFLYVIVSDENLENDEYVLNIPVEVTGTSPIPINKNVKLCCQVYITTLSETGVLCKIDFGTVSIDILSLLKQQASSLHSSKKYNLKIHSISGNPIKSEIEISDIHFGISELTTKNLVELTQTSIFEKRGDHNIMKSTLDPWANSKDNYYKGLMWMNTYLHETSKFDNHFKKFLRGKTIKCPTNPGQSTLDNTDLSLPIVSFLYGKTLEITETFITHQLTLYATRFLISKKEWTPTHYVNLMEGRINSQSILTDFGKYFVNSSVAEKASLTVNFLSQYIQMLEYITDITIVQNEKVNIELFGDPISSQCGDCEDFSYGTYQIIKAFRYFKNFTFNNYTFIFNEMKRILEGYVELITIMGVTTNSIQNANISSENGSSLSEDEDNVKLPPKIKSGHAALVLIPFDLFYKYLSRWSKNHELTKAVYKDKMEFIEKHKDLKDLVVLIAEGTGIFESGVLNDEMTNERSKFYENCSVIEKIKKPIIPKTRKESPFYSAVLFGFTDRYLNTNKIGTFYFATINPSSKYKLKQNTNSEETTQKYFQNKNFGRGCVFSEFITDDECIMIVPNLCVDDNTNSKEFDDFILKMMEDVSKIKIPTPKLNVTRVTTENLNKCLIDVFQNEQLTKSGIKDGTLIICNHKFTKIEVDLLIEFIQKVNDLLFSTLSGKTIYGAISFYLLEDYIDSTLIDSLSEYILNEDQYHIGKIQAYKEYHTDDFYVYRIDFLYYH